jgi:hypothetical protein
MSAVSSIGDALGQWALTITRGELRKRKADILTASGSPTKVAGMVPRSETSMMAIALAEARAAGEHGEVPVGAVIAGRDATILARVRGMTSRLRAAGPHPISG